MSLMRKKLACVFFNSSLLFGEFYVPPRDRVRYTHDARDEGQDARSAVSEFVGFDRE